MDQQNTAEKRTRHRDGNQGCGPQSQHRQRDDHHQQHRNSHVVGEVRQHRANLFGIVLRDSDMQVAGPSGLLGFHHRRHLINQLDDVGAGALADFQCDGGIAIKAGVVVGVFVSAPQGSDILERHRTLAISLDRHVQQVVQLFNDAWDLDREATMPGIHCTSCHQTVVAIDEVGQLGITEAVTFERHRINNDFQQLFAITAHCRIQHAGETFQFVTQILGYRHQRAFRYVTVQHYHQDGKLGNIDLLHERFFRITRQFRPRKVNLGTYIGQCLVGIETGIKFKNDHTAALRGGGAHLLETIERTQLRFHWADQHALGIFR